MAIFRSKVYNLHKKRRPERPYNMDCDSKKKEKIDDGIAVTLSYQKPLPEAMDQRLGIVLRSPTRPSYPFSGVFCFLPFYFRHSLRAL